MGTHPNTVMLHTVSWDIVITRVQPRHCEGEARNNPKCTGIALSFLLAMTLCVAMTLRRVRGAIF
jgi:hypothetical protein